jgi:hypothetical protein
MLEIRLAKLHPAQQAIVDSRARFKVLACGRRFGKTAVAIDILCNQLLDGHSAAYFAPTFRMGAEVWRELHQLLRPLIRLAREDSWRMELHTGGVFEGWSLAQGAGELVRGRKYHYVVMDEAALFDSADAWHGAIRPLLTDYEGGALFASTPRGRNWFWQLFLQGQNAGFPDWEAWQYPTAANPHIKAAEIEAARLGMPERFFRQEYEAVFLDDGGAVFRNVEGTCILTPQPVNLTPRPPLQSIYLTPQPPLHSIYLTPQPPLHSMERGSEEVGQAYYFGVDWGKENDYTCVSVMTREGRQGWLERFNQIGWAVQRGRLTQLYERFRPSVILAEENSIGSVNIEALQAEGLPMRGFMTTAKSKGPLIDHLALAMEKAEVMLLNDPILKHELMAYEMKRTSQGWAYSAPPGGHDDTVIATALSLWAAKRFGGVLWGWA